MSEIIILLAHPDINTSTTQQFFIESGKFWTDATYIDLYEEMANEAQRLTSIREQMRAADQLFFQFPVYWYQAPACLSKWIVKLFSDDPEGRAFARSMRGKTFGVIPFFGAKESHFQRGGKDHYTISELMVPYEMLANHLEWRYLPVFNIHQFNYLSEEEQMDLMMRYACYIETGNKDHEQHYYEYILSKLQSLTHKDLPLNEFDQQLFDLFIEEYQDQLDEFNELLMLREDQ